MQPNYSFLFIQKVKHIFPGDMSARFSSAIDTDFELELNNLSATVYNTLPQHSKVRTIAQHSKENIEMTSFAPVEFFGAARLLSTHK